jgi:short-subunit dehydrogenase
MGHVLVTGASAGIGEALARAFVARGDHVTVVARRVDRLQALAAELGERVSVLAADLSSSAEADRMFAAASSSRPVDVLVNNAGVQIVASVGRTDPDAADALLAVDLGVPLRLIHRALPGMLERKRGAIVNVASMAALSPVPGMLWYNAAKGGLANASESLRGELRGTGVNVVTVYPGPVHTDMGTKGLAAYKPTLAARLTPWGDSTTLARRVVSAVASGSARVIYPRPYWVSLFANNLSRWVSLRAAPPLQEG